MTDNSRAARGHKTIVAMINLYCHDQHGTEEQLCSDCQGLLDYAHERLDKCPFGEDKPTCAKCTVHCYQSEMRERVSAVMRYTGPRMMRRHPILAMHHLLDGVRKKPE